jgi:putative transposase
VTNKTGTLEDQLERQIATVYKYPLRISPTAASTLYQWSCACRYLWNRSLRLKRGLYERYKLHMGYMGMKLADGTETGGTNKRLTVLRNRYDWLGAIPNCCQQEVLRDLDKAFQAFFRRIKRGETPGYPRFKHRGDLGRLYFSQERFSINIDEEGRHYLKLSKIKQAIRIDVDRSYLEHPADKIISCSIVHERDYWYVCLLVNKTIDTVIRDLPPIGINRGIVRTVALSDGSGYQIPNDRLKALEARKAVLQHRLARKVGSKKFEQKSGHWLRQKHQIDRIDSAMADIRLNFNHQTSRDIVNHYGDIGVESYEIKRMTKSAKGTVQEPGTNVQVKADFNRAQLRNAWGGLVTMLEYKAAWGGHTVTKTSVPYITQECSSCGHVDPENVQESKRLFLCVKCGFTKDMDTNAAVNVLHRSIKENAPAGSPG